MITLTRTISIIKQISDGTHDTSTQIELIDLSVALKESLYGNNRSWDYRSIATGFLIGFAVCILLFSSKVFADEINVNLTSWHSDKSYSYNEKNYGLGYTMDVNHHWQVKAGFYENSYKKQSNYLMANLKHDMRNWRWGVQFGFVTGYDDIEKQNEKIGYSEAYYDDDSHDDKGDEKENPSNIKNLNEYQFIVLPTITWKATKQHSLTIGYMPSFSKNTFSFATATYNYTF